MISSCESTPWQVLKELINEGEANELARRREATVEGKKLMKVEDEEDDLIA